MFSADINGPDCWKCSLKVEWHDCSWCPAIVLRRGLEIRSGTATKSSPSPSLLPNPDRRKNLPKPMKTIVNRKSQIGNYRAFTLVELLTVIAIIAILAAMLLPVLAKAKVAAQKMKAKTEIADLVTAINAYDTDYGRFPVIKPEQQYAQTTASGDFTCGLVQYPDAPNTTLVWPPVGTPPIYSYDNNSNVVAVLMDLQTYPNGNVTSNNFHVYNPKQVKYLSAKMSGYDPASNDPNPPGGVDNTGIYRDPWGNPYIISMDLNYDDQCQDAFYDLNAVSGNNQTKNNPGLNGLTNPDTTKDNNFQFHGKIMVWSAGPDKKYDPTIPATTGVNKDNILSW